MTHDEMAAIIKQGRGIIHNGIVITRIEDLPPPENVDNPAAIESRIADTEAKIKTLQAERDRLKVALKTVAQPAPVAEKK